MMLGTTCKVKLVREMRIPRIWYDGTTDQREHDTQDSERHAFVRYACFPTASVMMAKCDGGQSF